MTETGKVQSITTVFQKTAWQQYPDAQTAQAACSTYAFDLRLAEVVNEFAARPQSATPIQTAKDFISRINQFIDETTFETRSAFPNSLKVTLSEQLNIAKHLNDQDLNDQADSLRAKIFVASPSLDQGFNVWQFERLMKSMKAIGKDPLIKDAQERWNDPSFTLDDKMAVARRINNHYAAGFDMAPDQIGYMYEKGIHGDQSNRIRLSLAPGMALRGDNFSEFFKTVVHEATHTLQNQIAIRWNAREQIQGDILSNMQVSSSEDLSAEGQEVFKALRDRKMAEAFPNDPSVSWYPEFEKDGKLHSVASLFTHQKLGVGYLYNDIHGDQINYRRNPVEQHAFETADIVFAYFNLPESGKQQWEADFAKLLPAEQEVFEGIVQARKDIVTSNKLCQ